ncbi:MAG: TetR/AcrR family transcriptional regulator [Pseudomonadota bacterium]|jgi:Transcriptional regulator|nr:MAG: hypothetical protein DIU56_12490 [Pseudomonadota bacterium]
MRRNVSAVGAPSPPGSEAEDRWSLPAKQARSRETRERLIAAGFRLLRRKTFDELSVAEIARAAGCSVGAFYVRFADKDHFFLALIDRFRARRQAALEEMYARTTPETVVHDAVRREYAIVGEHLNLWRAALKRGMKDPGFWEIFRATGRRATDRFLEYRAACLGRALTEREIADIRFAFQVVRGTINNTIVNAPGPLSADDPEFLPQLERAFRLVAGIEPGTQSR